MSTTNPVGLLILGAGWTSDFLIPLLARRHIAFAATTRDGRSRSGVDTIKFHFGDGGDEHAAFSQLPDARTVLVTFPIRVRGASARLVRLYAETHPGSEPRFVQLGSTGIWDFEVRRSPSLVPRAVAERGVGQ